MDQPSVHVIAEEIDYIKLCMTLLRICIAIVCSNYVKLKLYIKL